MGKLEKKPKKSKEKVTKIFKVEKINTKFKQKTTDKIKRGAEISISKPHTSGHILPKSIESTVGFKENTIADKLSKAVSEEDKDQISNVQETKPKKINCDTKNKKKVSEASKEKAFNAEDNDRTVFVGNLPPNTKKLQLCKLFSTFGEIKSVRFRTSDGKKLFKHKTRKDANSLNAYIVMTDIKSAEKAIEMSGTDFKGHHIRITRANKSSEELDAKRIVFVGNLKYSATDENLFDIFSTCGAIEYVRTLQSSKGCKGIAYVCFKNSESVGLALELNNTLLDERPIRVERYSKHKLGAYEKRKEEVKQLTGASRRVKERKKNSNGPGDTGKIKKPSKEIKKKSQFRGLQIDFKKKSKKKKKSNQMLQLAKKIAPKT